VVEQWAEQPSGCTKRSDSRAARFFLDQAASPDGKGVPRMIGCSFERAASRLRPAPGPGTRAGRLRLPGLAGQPQRRRDSLDRPRRTAALSVGQERGCVWTGWQEIDPRSIGPVKRRMAWMWTSKVSAHMNVGPRYDGCVIMPTVVLDYKDASPCSMTGGTHLCCLSRGLSAVSSAAPSSASNAAVPTVRALTVCLSCLFVQICVSTTHVII